MRRRDLFSKKARTADLRWASLKWWILVGVYLLPLSFFAQTPSLRQDTIQRQPRFVASLLTCAPGAEVYELYGHTALRLRNIDTGEDVVYNYGWFNFHRPHFVWHFILGETDYTLRAMDFMRFYMRYTEEGRWIDEQVLRLTDEELQRLHRSLSDNERKAEEDGWTYRYNYFTDNCTTRAIDQIRHAIQGEMVLNDKDTTAQSYRSSLHAYTSEHPWAQLGNDMLLGCESDCDISATQRLFLPIEAEKLLGEALVVRNGVEMPLVGFQQRISDPPYAPEDTAPAIAGIAPMWWFGALLIVCIALTYYERKHKKYCWAFDLTGIALQGIAGCLIAFMVLFSQHPTVGTNLLITVFNPLPLLLLWPIVVWHKRGKRPYFAYLETAFVAAYAVIAILGIQRFPTEIHLTAACILLRALAYILYQKGRIRQHSPSVR